MSFLERGALFSPVLDDKTRVVAATKHFVTALVLQTQPPPADRAPPDTGLSWTQPVFRAGGPPTRRPLGEASHSRQLLTSAIAASTIVGAIGLASAQSSTEPSTATTPQTQDQNSTMTPAQAAPDTSTQTPAPAAGSDSSTSPSPATSSEPAPKPDRN
jgi:hypothetical protein